ncbi:MULTISPECIES: hypothetical protein [Marinobacter]|jgi:hypothetical protein|uniref:hypothetical protein n=1 Tax=Marinobacter TaxID=2742 RepID=UPI000A5E9315|nr:MULTISPECIES: hypothetical protein [Marinobacter]MDM8181823.1 hypothetical protein [Marinobacter salarius]
MNKMPTSFFIKRISAALFITESMEMSKEKPKKQAKKTLKEKRKDKKQKNA